MQVEFHILGPLEVLDARGSRIDLGGTRERTLLALLLLTPDQVVPAARLAEEMWGERMPEGAAHALRVHVSRLRRSLRPAGADGLLVTRTPGYAFRVDAGSLDAGRFELLLARGRTETSDGQHATASQTLRDALALWRGPVLADLVDVPAVRMEAARLEEARLVAVEERVEADLACGRHGELVGELDGFTRAHPMRERMWQQRMLALYRAGRQGEALRVHGELRALLDTELGIEPGAAVRELHTAILRQDPDLGPQPPSRSPDAPGPSRSAAMSMPPLLTEMGRIFVGRGAELDQLNGLWQQDDSPAPRLVLLSGEPGVGKTRLAAEFAGTVRAAHGTVLAGRCDEDLAVPYQPFVEALRDFVGRVPGPREGLGRYAGELSRLVPEIAQRLPDLPPPLRSDPETERYRLFDAVAGWLAVASGERPVLLVLDDVHWAAKPTLQLLRHVSRSAQARRLIIVATYRDTELGRTHPLTELLADLRRQPGVKRIRLTGLDEPSVIAFMERSAGHDLAADDLPLARAIHSETDGNPFFVREVLRHLTETGKIDRQDERWGARLRVEELGIPDGVREVVTRRLSRLSEETNRVLRVAAVVGAEFDLPVVAEAGEIAEEALLTALEEAIDARLVIDAPGGTQRYRFGHAIVRSTLHQELTSARRARLHRRVATAIERLYPGDLDEHLPALVHHWARAVAQPERAVDYAERAGRRAASQLANDEATTYFRQALELLPAAGEPRRVGLLIALGDAQRRAGDAAHRQTLLAAAGLARTRGDVGGLARAAIANSPGSKPSVFGITDHDRVAALEAALDAVGPEDGSTRARLLAVLALELFHTGDRRRRLDLSDEALAIARRLDDPEVLSHVLVARPFAIGGPDTLAARLTDTAELLQVAQRLDDPVTEHRAWWSRFRVTVEVGDIAAADRCLTAQHELMADIGQPTLEWMTGLQEVARVLRQGRLSEAEKLVPAVYAQGRLAGQPDARLYYAIQLFQLSFDQGRVGAAEDVLRDVVAAAPELPAIRAALAVLCAEQGRLDRARTLFDDIAQDDFAALPVEASTMVTFAFCSDLCPALRDVRRAGQLYRLLAPYPDQIAVWAVGLGVGSVAHRLGLLAHTLGDLDRADAHLAAAAEIDQRVDAPVWLARTRLAHARTLLARGGSGDRERAAHLSSLAREVLVTGQ